MSDKDRNRTHIFSTFFYETLTANTPNRSVKENVNLSPAQKRHERVKRWTYDVNIFEKDFIIVPIDKNKKHWVLAIICFPGLDGCREIETDKPCTVPVRQQKAVKMAADKSISTTIIGIDPDVRDKLLNKSDWNDQINEKDINL